MRGDVYACVYEGDIYKRSNGKGAFVALGQTSRRWSCMCESLNGDIYAGVSNGDIYVQTRGNGNFVGLGVTSKNWTGLTCNSAGDVYASAYGEDIYVQTGGQGSFVATGQTYRNWYSLGSVGLDVFSGVYNGDTYKRSEGVGTFTAIGGTSRGWCSMTPRASKFGDLYQEDQNSNRLFLRDVNEGLFDIEELVLANIFGVSIAPDGTVYAPTYNGTIWSKPPGGAWASLGETSRLWSGGCSAWVVPDKPFGRALLPGFAPIKSEDW